MDESSIVFIREQSGMKTTEYTQILAFGSVLYTMRNHSEEADKRTTVIFVSEYREQLKAIYYARIFQTPVGGVSGDGG